MSYFWSGIGPENTYLIFNSRYIDVNNNDNNINLKRYSCHSGAMSDIHPTSGHYENVWTHRILHEVSTCQH